MRHVKRISQKLLLPFQAPMPFGHDVAKERSELLFKLRIGAIIGQLFAIIPAMHYDYLLQDKLPFYLLTVCALALVNPFAKNWKSPAGIFAQLSIDMFALGTLLILTAGCHNPFSAMIFVSGILGPMFLSRRWTLLYLALAAVTLSIVCFFTEPVLRNANGHEVSAVVTVFVKILVLFTLGGLTLWLKYCLDAAQERYLKLFKQKQRLNNFRALGVVAGQLSHELSTPLNTMKILLDRMARQRSDRELEMSRAALDQCSEIVKRLFETNVDAEGLDYKETQIADFVSSICEKWSLDFPSVRCRVDVQESARAIACKVPTSPFTQAVLDILDNAMEASAPQQADIQVLVENRGESLGISISDRGSGMDDETQKRLGEPFVSTKESGTGLGLYNALALLEALGGMLNIHPRAGGGTTVSMVLPI